MAEWRIGRGWTEEELSERLHSIENAPRNFDELSLAEMTRERGYQPEHSESLVGHEAPGAPIEDGVFDRARWVLRHYAFSDPTIVEGHYEPQASLLNRYMLLELKPCGIHYLCPVQVSDVTEHSSPTETVFGFRYDTLRGHLERGSEWFVVTKDHADGAVRLRIESRWQEGEFPNVWSAIGFSLLAPAYRQVWLRRAHERVRALVQTTPSVHRGGRLLHVGQATTQLPHVDGANPTRTVLLLYAFALGTLAGVRSSSSGALLATRSVIAGPRPGATKLEQGLASPTVALAALSAFGGELLADKTRWVGSRTALLPLLGRMFGGALSGFMLARRWSRTPLAPAAVGAAAAGLSAYASRHVRSRLARRLGGPARAGMAEDAVLMLAALALARGLSRRDPAEFSVERTQVDDEAAIPRLERQLG